MLAQFRSLLRLDLDAVDLHKGVMGVVAIAVTVIFVAIFGTVGMTAGLAALFVIMGDQPGSLRDRGLGVLVMTVFGSCIALVAVWSGTSHVWLATLLVFVVTGVATLAAGLGKGAVTRGLLLSIWAVVALSMGGDTESAIELAVAFAVGGLIAAGVIWVRTRALPEPSIEAEAKAARHSLGEIARSPLGWFSLLRASAAGLAMAIGGLLFPEHAIWGALTVLLVMKPKAGEAVGAGLLRTLGTLVGVLVAEAVLAISGGNEAIVIIGFLAAAFGMAALHNVNYAVFVSCLTALLVLSQDLIGESADTAAIDRLLATILGAGIAFIGIGLGRWILARRPASQSGGNGSTIDDQGDSDTTPG